MTRTKWFLSFFFLGLLALAAVFYYFRSVMPPEALSPSAQPSISAAQNGQAQKEGGNQPPPSEKETAVAFEAGTPMKRVMELYETESKRVGAVDPDPKATQKRLESIARQLKKEEIEWLERQSMDPLSDADARFFAVYLMGLSAQESAVASLTRIATQPIHPSKNARKNSEERSLRASAVEGMSRSCKEFPGAVKDGLLEVISGQTDEFLRDRAHRGLYACQTGKQIEEQDKEALRKLRKKK